MSQYPPPYDPLSYASPQYPQKRTPTSVTTLAVLAIIFGSLGVLGSLCSLPQYFGMKLTPNPVMDRIREDDLLLAWSIGTLAVGFVLSLLELYAGIGSMSLQPAARKTFIGFAWAKIGVSVIEIVASLLVINSRMNDIMQSTLVGNTGPNAQQMKMFMKIGMYAGSIGSIIFLVWPILILYFMSREKVKAAFAGQMQAPPTGGYYSA
jgi:hypothetical protein